MTIMCYNQLAIGGINLLDIILDTLIDSLKMLPFLFVAFLLIELIEHKFSDKTKKVISSSGKFGPLLGGVLGAIPQCGFSVLATNLYITRIVSLGTLIAIYLSTSDEMLPILLSHGENIGTILQILGIKLIVGIIFGIIIDLVTWKKTEKINYHICEQKHCDCKHGIFLSAFKHTLNTLVFIFVVTFILNAAFHYLGEDYLRNVLSKNNFFTPFIASLIGLIPNCAASVVITELYLNDVISLAPTISGLLTGSGVALLVLFDVNKNIKENIKIIGLLYGIGVFVGLIIELISMI